MQLNVDDIKGIKNSYPNLRIDSLGLVIEGIIDFCGAYNHELNQFVVLNDAAWICKGWLVLSGKYSINISLQNDGLPQLKMDDKEVEIETDRHFNLHNKIACLCGPSQEAAFISSGMNIQSFIEGLIIPFLYGQKFYDKNKKWPWNEYSHGALGILESYYHAVDITSLEFCIEKLKTHANDWNIIEKIIKRKIKIKGHIQCWCGSKNKIRDCHADAWRGLIKLQEDFNGLNF